MQETRITRPPPFRVGLMPPVSPAESNPGSASMRDRYRGQVEVAVPDGQGQPPAAVVSLPRRIVIRDQGFGREPTRQPVIQARRDLEQINGFLVSAKQEPNRRHGVKKEPEGEAEDQPTQLSGPQNNRKGMVMQVVVRCRAAARIHGWLSANFSVPASIRASQPQHQGPATLEATRPLSASLFTSNTARQAI